MKRCRSSCVLSGTSMAGQLDSHCCTKTEMSINSFQGQIFVPFCRLEQEKSALQKRGKARPVTTDQVVAAQTSEMENEIEELKKKNSELEAQISTIK